MNMYQRLENRIFGTEFLHDDGEDYYQYCSAIPVGTLLAQTFDTELLGGSRPHDRRRVGGVRRDPSGSAPGMNIHRNPLCGRNFEYYSRIRLSAEKWRQPSQEARPEPVRGRNDHQTLRLQQSGRNRRGVSSIVSERALREIYLKGFEIGNQRIPAKGDRDLLQQGKRCPHRQQPTICAQPLQRANGALPASS